jgi:hypothetical protein
MRYGVHIRALVGLLAVILAVVFLVGHPGVSFAWIEEHKFVDALIALAAIVFHLWNTYQLPRPSMFKGE